MRSKVAPGIWLPGISLSWMAVAPAALKLLPLVDAQGAALGWWWPLHQHSICLSGRGRNPFAGAAGITPARQGQ